MVKITQTGMHAHAHTHKTATTTIKTVDCLALIFEQQIEELFCLHMQFLLYSNEVLCNLSDKACFGNPKQTVRKVIIGYNLFPEMND